MYAFFGSIKMHRRYDLKEEKVRNNKLEYNEVITRKDRICREMVSHSGILPAL
jgi:hypothetical protein